MRIEFEKPAHTLKVGDRFFWLGDCYTAKSIVAEDFHGMKVVRVGISIGAFFITVWFPYEGKVSTREGYNWEIYVEGLLLWSGIALFSFLLAKLLG